MAGVPPPEIEIPAQVRRLGAGLAITPVWLNEVGGLTVALGRDPVVRYVKWDPTGSPVDLSAEHRRLAWAGQWLTVPKVLEAGDDADGAWLVTAAIAAGNAVADRWLRRPEPAVRAIGTGLRHLHDSLPVDGCPFSWRAGERVDDAGRRAAAGLIDPAGWAPEHRGLSLAGALAQVAEPPPIDRLVVCHADACAPNTLVSDVGELVGHVDLGRLGVADRWADLAIASWSLDWNYGPGWQPALFDAYGIDADDDDGRRRLAYYRLLWDLGP